MKALRARVSFGSAHASETRRGSGSTTNDSASGKTVKYFVAEPFGEARADAWRFTHLFPSDANNESDHLAQESCSELWLQPRLDP